MSKKKPAPSPVPESLPRLRLEYIRPSELDPNPANWRTHPDTQVKALADVIGEVGWAGAVLLNEQTGRLIDGHARKKIAEGNDEPVPVLIGSWTEEQERLILLTLDPIGAMAQADAKALEGLLETVEGSTAAISDLLQSIAEDYAVLPDSTQGEVVEDPAGEWEGMPEYSNPPRAHKTIHCHFATERDVELFAKLIGREAEVLQKGSKTLWFPNTPERDNGEIAWESTEDDGEELSGEELAELGDESELEPVEGSGESESE